MVQKLENVVIMSLEEYEKFAEAQVAKKEPKVGKWYKNTKCEGTIINLQIWNDNEKSGYGIHLGMWGNWGMLNYEDYTLATPQEVDKALIEEAKRRGFRYDSYIIDERTNILWGIDNDGKKEKALLNNEKWAEVIEVDKSQETPEFFNLMQLSEIAVEMTKAVQSLNERVIKLEKESTNG